MQKALRQYGTLSEIHERAQLIALMRFYARRWRPFDPEGGAPGCPRGSSRRGVVRTENLNPGVVVMESV